MLPCICVKRFEDFSQPDCLVHMPYQGICMRVCVCFCMYICVCVNTHTHTHKQFKRFEKLWRTLYMPVFIRVCVCV
jgi:hypothetical protein